MATGNGAEQTPLAILSPCQHCPVLTHGEMGLEEDDGYHTIPSVHIAQQGC